MLAKCGLASPVGFFGGVLPQSLCAGADIVVGFARDSTGYLIGACSAFATVRAQRSGGDQGETEMMMLVGGSPGLELQ